MKILFINACLRGREASRTYRLAQAFLEELEKIAKEEKMDELDLTEIDLCSEDVAPVKGKELALRDAAGEKQDFRDPFFDRARQFAEADRVIIAAPMWDLSFPSMLKIYLENICVTGLSFRYTEDGVQGLCRAEKLMYLATRGGDFSLPFMKDLEQGTPYLRSLCVMLGIGEMDAVSAEGLDVIGCDVEGVVRRAEEEARRKAADFLKSRK